MLFISFQDNNKKIKSLQIDKKEDSLDEVCKKINSEKGLDKEDILMKKKKFKKYRLLSNISLFIPLLFILTLALFNGNIGDIVSSILVAILMCEVVLFFIFRCISNKYL